MFCNNCGTKNADGVKFCSNCGAQLSAPAQETTVLNQNQQGVQQPISPVHPPKKSNGKMIGIICGVAVAVIAVIVAVVLALNLGGKDKKKDSDGESNNPSSKVEDVQKPTESKTEEPSTEPAMSYQETALAFMKALSKFDFNGANKYCILDNSEIFEIYANKNGLSLSALYSTLSQSFSEEFGEEVQFNSVSDIYSEFEKVLKKELTAEELASLIKEIENDKIVSTEKLDLSDSNDMDALIDDIISCDVFGLVEHINYTDYINLDDITEAYKVEFESGSWFFVVKYNGEWRVAASALQMFS